jgi:DNA polymerase bacteriophage-type
VKPYKKILTVDAETRWSTQPTSWSPDGPYTLSKMTTEAYIRDQRFKAFGFCVHEFGSSDAVEWYSHEELPALWASYDWSETAVLAHNSMFDVGIMSMVYGVKPCFILDSLSMARALFGVEVGNSLAKLATRYGLPDKGNAVHSTNGLEELTPLIERELAAYCKHDVFLCEEIYARLVNGILGTAARVELSRPYPTKELRLISTTLKMFTEPELLLDVPMLQKAMGEDNARLALALQRAGMEEATLASNIKFAAALEALGVSAPMKKSKTTGLPALALAKSDALFQAMLNGDNEDVAMLCEARLRVKSTLERTRAQRFIDIAANGALPVPLKYYGAETGRWSATGSVNLQNMKRGSFLRKSIMAPKGFMLCVGDLSQIEPRVLAWLSDYEDMLDIFRSGEDAYATFGAQMFNMPGMTKESHGLLRQSAKSALLGAGFQMGWASFAAQLLVGFLGAPPVLYSKADAKQLGVTQANVDKFLANEDYVKRMLEIPHICTEKELLVHCLAAKAIIDKYRSTAHPVTSFWELLSGLIQKSLIDGKEVTHKCLTFRKEEIVLPNGMSLKYPNLRMQAEINPETKKPTGKTQYVYGLEGTPAQKLYAGRICNNVTQATARIVMSDALLRIERRYPIKGAVHDEGIMLVPEAGAGEARDWIYAQMVQEPKWMQGIPLDADVDTGTRYGDVK